MKNSGDKPKIDPAPRPQPNIREIPIVQPTRPDTGQKGWGPPPKR